MERCYGSSRAMRMSRGDARSDDVLSWNTKRGEEILPMGAMTGMAWVRLLVGAVWLLAGLEKLLNPGFPALFGAVLETGGFIKDAPSWLQWFINSFVVPNSGSFAVLVGAGETVIGIGLVLGLLTNLSAVGGVFLGLTFVVDLGGLSIAYAAYLGV